MSDLGRYTLRLLQRSTPRYQSIKSFINSDVRLSEQFIKFQKSKSLDKQHYSVKSRRLNYDPLSIQNESIYFRFIEELYPLMNTQGIDFKKIEDWITTGKLQVSSMRPKHLNELLQVLIQSSGNFRHQNYFLLQKILREMKNHNIPTSIKEVNSLVYLENYASRQKLQENSDKFITMKERRLGRQFELLEEQFGSSLDISTINIFLKNAITYKSDNLLNKVSEKLNEKGEELKLDRISYELLLYHFGINHKDLEKSLQIIQVMDENYIKLDITFVNLIIKILVNNSQIETAQEIVEHLFDRYRKLREPFFRPQKNTRQQQDPIIIDAHTRRIHIEQMKFIDSLQLIGSSNQIIAELTPNFNTLSELLKHHSQLTNFELFEILKLLKTANHYEIPCALNVIINILNTFKEFEVFGMTEVDLLVAEIEEMPFPAASREKLKVLTQEIRQKVYETETRKLLESKRIFFNSSLGADSDYCPSFRFSRQTHS